MESIIFAILALLTLLTAILVVVCRSPIHSGLALAASSAGVAALLTLLDAHFLALAQLLIGTGGIGVLCLFVAAALNLEQEKRRKQRRSSLFLSVALGAILLGLLGRQLWSVSSAAEKSPPGDAAALGNLLFGEYLLPLWIVAILLLLALVGVVLLARKEKEMSESVKLRSA